MRLLNTKSFTLQVFLPDHVPDYVILSHRWCTGSDGECTHKDLTMYSLSDSDSPARKKEGFPKIQGACALAARDGYCWIWIDSCCIDKSSSAELQETINSMWNYYSGSNICYVYLADVLNSHASWDMRFHNSNWFTRAWTLQELIAPAFVEFFAKDWAPIGAKVERHKEIAAITTISPNILTGSLQLDSFSAAEKLSWAAHRKVTRGEDEAYSLLGLFDVNMPLLYGEGRVRAFMRLQETIYNSTTDHSLFLFRYTRHHWAEQPLLADSPQHFCNRTSCPFHTLHGFLCLPSGLLYQDVLASSKWSAQARELMMTTVTSYRNEVSTKLLLLDYKDVFDMPIFPRGKSHTTITHVAVLNHTLKTYAGGALCLLLCCLPGQKAFRRAGLFPTVLPSLQGLEAKIVKRRILICPAPGSVL